MQTLLGKVIGLFTKVIALTTAFMKVVYCFLELHGPFSRAISIAWVIAELFLLSIFYLTLLAMTVTKYCLIYHSSIMDDISEEKFLKYVKLAVFFLSMMLTVLEYTFISTFVNLSSYQLFHYGSLESDINVELMIQFLVIVNLVAASLLYARLQYSDILAEDQTSGILSRSILRCTRNSHGNVVIQEPILEFGYNIIVLRVCLLIGFLVVAFFSFNMGISFKWNVFLINMQFTVAFPLILVLKNPGMRNVAFHLLRDVVSIVA